MLSNRLIHCCPFLLWPSIFPNIKVFTNESALCIRWLKFWSFSFSISLSKEYSGLFPLGLIGLISFQSKGILSSPASQFKSINSLVFSLLYGSTLTSVHDYWKTIALTICTFVSKVVSLLLNTLSMFVITLLPWKKESQFHDCSHHQQ